MRKIAELFFLKTNPFPPLQLRNHSLAHHEQFSEMLEGQVLSLFYQSSCKDKEGQTEQFGLSYLLSSAVTPKCIGFGEETRKREKRSLILATASLFNVCTHQAI